MLFAACKDPNTGPGEPQEDAGYIQFESPAVGQKSSFVHFYAKGYWEETPSTLTYTRDTIHWEITKQIDRNTYQITERLSGELFGDLATNRELRILTLTKKDKSILITSGRSLSSPLVGYNDSLVLKLNNDIQYPFTDWRIGEITSTAAYDGYVIDYKIKDKQYNKLDVYSDFTPTHRDGTGLMFAYNGKYGLVRYYGMNPWLGDVSGFDLIRDLKKPTDELKELNGTKWRLKNVFYKDGSVKSVKDASYDSPFADQFIAEFKDNNTIEGYSGCNTYGGTYNIDGNKITINAGSLTEAYCGFGAIYDKIMRNSTIYNAKEGTLTIYSDYEEYSGLEFERVYEPEVFQLEGTEWVLYNVHYNNGDIVPIGRILGTNSTNPAFSQFELKFMENNLLGGFSGCNTFGGEYIIDKNKIKIEAGSITEVGCKFSDEYGKILSASTTYSADRNRLIIYSSYERYKALEFGIKFR